MPHIIRHDKDYPDGREASEDELAMSVEIDGDDLILTDCYGNRLSSDERSQNLPITLKRNTKSAFGFSVNSYYYDKTDERWNGVASGYSYLPEANNTTPLEITMQPESVVADKAGDIAKLSVEAVGDGLTYTWYFNTVGGSKFYASSVKEPKYEPSVTADKDGRQIYCVVSDQYGNSVQSDTVTISIRKAKDLKIVKQPENVEVESEGEMAKARVEAEGDGLTYTWYVKDKTGSSFSKSSLKTAEYTLTMTAAQDGRQIYCVVEDAYGNTVTSETVTFSIVKRTELKIVKQPESVEVESEGAVAKSRVEAEGDGLTYTWYVKDKTGSSFSKSSLKTAEYTLTMTADKDGRQIYCVVGDAYGNTVTSETVTFSIVKKTELKIVKQPESVVVEKAGDTAKLSVEAIGDELSYTWYYNVSGGSKFYISSIKDSKYEPVVTKEKDGRMIYCVVEDKYGNQVQSEVITISIQK